MTPQPKGPRLPLELVQFIVEELFWTSFNCKQRASRMLNIVKTCQSWKLIAEPLLYSDISLEYDDDTTWSYLARTVTAHSRFGMYIRNLAITDEEDLLEFSTWLKKIVCPRAAVQVLGSAPNIMKLSHDPPMRADSCTALTKCSNITVLDIGLTLNTDIEVALGTVASLTQLRKLSMHWQYAQCTVHDLEFVPGDHMLTGIRLPQLSRFSWVCTDVQGRHRSFQWGLHWLTQCHFEAAREVSLYGPGVYLNEGELVPFYLNHAGATWNVSNIRGRGILDALGNIRGSMKCALHELVGEITAIDAATTRLNSLPATLILTIFHMHNQKAVESLAKLLHILAQREVQTSSLAPTKIYLEHSIARENVLMTRDEVEQYLPGILANSVLEYLNTAKIILAFAE